jgi:hypothetical protein
MKIIERTDLGLILLMVGLHKYRLVAGYDHHPLGPVLGMPVPATGLTGFIYYNLMRNDHHPLGPVLGIPVPATGLTGFISIIRKEGIT